MSAQGTPSVGRPARRRSRAGSSRWRTWRGPRPARPRRRAARRPPRSAAGGPGSARVAADLHGQCRRSSVPVIGAMAHRRGRCGEDWAVTRTVEMPGTATLGVRRGRRVGPPPGDPGGGRARARTGVVLKLETLQPTGSFKVRGGLAAVAAAERRRPGPALVTAVGRQPRARGRLRRRPAGGQGHGGGRRDGVGGQGARPCSLRGDPGAPRDLLRRGRGPGARARPTRSTATSSRPTTMPTSSPGRPRWAPSCRPGARPATVVVPVGGGGLLSGIGLATAGSVHLVGVESSSLAGHGRRGGRRRGGARPGRTDDGRRSGRQHRARLGHRVPGPPVSAFVAVTEEEIARSRPPPGLRARARGRGLGAVGVAALQAGRLWRPTTARRWWW